MDWYRERVGGTWNREHSREMRRLHGAIGMADEAGEVLGLLKKHMFNGHALPLDAVCEELGDVLYYLDATAAEFGLTLDQVAQSNVVKLEARYPDGYSHRASRQRKDKAG